MCRNVSLPVKHIITGIILSKQKWHAPHSEVMMMGLVRNHAYQLGLLGAKLTELDIINSHVKAQ